MTRSLDDVLLEWSAPVPSCALREAVLAAAPPPQGAGRFRRGWIWAMAGGLAAAASAGLAVGVWSAPLNVVDDGAAVSALLSPYDPAADLPDAEVVG